MIELQGITKRYGDAIAVDDVSFVVGDGELAVLLGPSGCGKTTTLRAINRMVEVDEGVVSLDGRPVSERSGDELRRHIGYAIQGVGLFPHMTVHRNIAAVPRLLGWDKRRIDSRVSELLELVGLPAACARRKPRDLSGGEAQRVGVARALAADPPVLLMDEPFGALDPINRERVQREFAELQRELRKTVVFVTHDIDEAILLGDRILLMRDGRLVQSGSPESLWRSPSSDFVRSFFGNEFGLRILSRHRVSDLRLGDLPRNGAPAVHLATNLRDVLARMVTDGCDHVAVLGDDGAPRGGLTVHDVISGIRSLS